MTPFVEMSALIEADVIVPWDDFIPQEVLDDMIPSIREECTIDGKLYSWPFLLGRHHHGLELPDDRSGRHF